MTGTVSKLIVARGFGFIKPEDGSGDVFLHATKMIGGSAAFEALCVGDRVSFDTYFDQERQSIRAEHVEEIRS